MNQQPYIDVNQQHGTPTAPAPGYGYGQPQALPPGTQYQPGPPNYYAHQYSSMAPMAAGHAVTTSMSHAMTQSHPMPTMPAAGGPPGGAQQYAAQPGHQYDTTGQVAPPGMKPRVTATLWEDEGSLCFQVEANGVCVARREDNHMINGTKLLNVAGMTRGRRDGILKSEKTRHVVKIGPMHLKGVWIPFDRALDFANKEKITEMLYPLFVHNIGALLYHPTNTQRGSMSGAPAMGAQRPSESRQSDYMRTPTGSQPPSLTHHHSMNNPVGASMQQPPHSIAPHPSSGRPGLDRAHTFPTPPASASSLIGMGTSGSSYDYGAAQTSNMHPASTPPQSATGTMTYPSNQPYDPSRGVYAPNSAYGQYTPGHQYAPGIKTDVDQARPGAENDHTEAKVNTSYPAHTETDGDGEYTHGRQVHPDSSHISPQMTHSPQQNGSGRATPRTTTASYTGYGTPQRGQLPSSNLYNVMSNDNRTTNGAEGYPSQNYQSQQYPSMNGISGTKRMREVEDSDEQFARMGSPGANLKRQRTDGGNVSRPISQPHSVKPVR